MAIAAPNTAYSYIRFSTRKQAEGESLRRQTELAVKYARKHGLKLDTTLNLHDLGVSAYDRSNALTGAFSGFMSAVESGKVKRGSYLLVEQFDRMSRAKPLVALRQLETLISAGIRVVTLQDEKIYDEDSADDLGSLMVSLAIMARAHDESATKSKRIGDAWQAKRNRREAVLTTECPSWLAPRADRSGFDIIEDKASSVRRVFEMTVGGYGNSTIVRLANTEGWTHPGRAKTWNQSIISKLVRNRACIGEYQPQKRDSETGKKGPTGSAWTGHYPSVVSDEIFTLANAAKDRKAKIPRRRDSHYKNLFQGLLTCGNCGSSMVRKNKGGVTVQNGYFIYMCSHRVEHVTRCRSSKGVELEGSLLQNLYLYGYSHMRTDEESQRLHAQDVVLNAELAENKAAVARMLDILVGRDIADLPQLGDRLQAAEARIKEIKAQLALTKAQISQLKLADSNVQEMMRNTFDIDYARMRDNDEIEFRAQLREKILSVLRRVVVFPHRGAAVVLYRHIPEAFVQPLDSQLYDMQMSTDIELIEKAKTYLKVTD